ncbi:hypothetical protein GCM10011504_03870 [Siccirubricoccus deserti]|uniref:Uncharacterized protein n=1 Tax=Siccirubricoccus deserti TaxID=2013562 RepID=A0A9X0QU69_9PROT|nr:hypothetical protein [Siccirubricoccus deserti]MBC4013715.1 hypothetical protein [Siccirubricoccus deserti]GGC28928.1 hypothetical protein GCM10011504_03870 [Siccirubricoccus deserti]
MPQAKSPKEALEEAIERYRSAFGAEALPCLCCVTDAAKAVAAAMLEHAVCTRRALRYGQVSAALGQTTPLGGSL